jgi:hypothetical protein
MKIEVLSKVLNHTYHIFKIKVTNNTDTEIQLDASLFDATGCIPVLSIKEDLPYKEEKQLTKVTLQPKESAKGFIAFRSREFILFPDIFYNNEKIEYGVIPIEKKKKEKKEKSKQNKGEDFLKKMGERNGTN